MATRVRRCAAGVEGGYGQGLSLGLPQRRHQDTVRSPAQQAARGPFDSSVRPDAPSVRGPPVRTSVGLPSAGRARPVEGVAGGHGMCGVSRTRHRGRGREVRSAAGVSPAQSVVPGGLARHVALPHASPRVRVSEVLRRLSRRSSRQGFGGSADLAGARRRPCCRSRSARQATGCGADGGPHAAATGSSEDVRRTAITPRGTVPRMARRQRTPGRAGHLGLHALAGGSGRATACRRPECARMSDSTGWLTHYPE